MITIMFTEIYSTFAGARERHFDGGSTVFRAGAEITHVYFVRLGCAALVRTLASGDTLHLQRANPGDVVAEASVYTEHYHCDCIALEPTVLAMLPRQTFRQALRNNATLSEQWATYLARTVQSTRMRAEIRSLKTVADRLDVWMAEYGPLPEKGRWQDVAHELSVSREAFYRELARRKSG